MIKLHLEEIKDIDNIEDMLEHLELCFRGHILSMEDYIKYMAKIEELVRTINICYNPE